MKLTKEEVLAKSKYWQLNNVKEYADYLVNSKYRLVREKVAIKGNDTHRDILVRDVEWGVREEISIYGNDTHRDILVHDTDSMVQRSAERYMGSTYHLVATDFGTYSGDLHLWVWEDKYEIRSGCYWTIDIEEWFDKCESQLDTTTATKYTNIMKDIIGGI